MALVEGFENLSGTPLVPSGGEITWTAGSQANLANSSSASFVTQGSFSYRVNGTADSDFSEWSLDGSVDLTGATELSIDITVQTNTGENAAAGLFLTKGEANVSDITANGFTGTTTLSVDLSVFGGDLTGINIALRLSFFLVGDGMDAYWDNLRDDAAGGASVGSGLITGSKLQRMSRV